MLLRRDPPVVAGFAGLLTDWADYNPLSRTQGEERERKGKSGENVPDDTEP